MNPDLDIRAFPWLSAAWGALIHRSDRLAHAFLISGRPGLGKTIFAAEAARFLLCSSPTPDAAACGQCKSCLLFIAGNHPDFYGIQPHEEGKAILVDQIRVLSDFLYLRPHIATRKVVIVSPADAMNISAANALLKLLEEPPADSHLLLISSRPHKLPATIRSRCLSLKIPAPSQGAAVAWIRNRPEAPASAELLLNITGYAPLTALALGRGGFLAHRQNWIQDAESLLGKAADPVGCAARWKAMGTEAGLAWLHGFLVDLIRVSLDSEPPKLFNPDIKPRLQDLQKRLHLNRLFSFFELVSTTRNQLGGPLDEQLLLENILIQWTRVTNADNG